MDVFEQKPVSPAVGSPEYNALLARVRELEGKVATKQAKALRFKVSNKGAVSVYGINTQFPVTLYREQWDRLIERIPDLQAFIAANRNLLREKGE